MMNRSLLRLMTLLLITGGLASTWWWHQQRKAHHQRLPFHTIKPSKRDIREKIYAQGVLEAQGTSKIGAAITGKVEKILIQEGQFVKKGKILALLDNVAGGDADMRQKAAALKQAEYSERYLRTNLARQKTLWLSGQLSQDNWEQAEQNYLKAAALVEQSKAALEQAQAAFEHTQVRAPHDGIVIDIPTTIGEAVAPTALPPSVICEIVKDLATMKVTLGIDESRIGHVKEGQKVRITVDTFPNRLWKGLVDSLGKNPYKATSGPLRTETRILYKATLVLENKDSLLLPGMSVHATIKVGKAKQVLALPSTVFGINNEQVEALAKMTDYAFKPLDAATKKALDKRSDQVIRKAIWTVQDKAFVQQIVTLGFNDLSHYQVIQGVDEQSTIIDHIEQSDAMKEIYKRFFGRGL